VLGREVPYYARDIEQRVGEKSRWCIVGDRQSRCFAESFELARVLLYFVLQVSGRQLLYLEIGLTALSVI
jgi:hypothetical protein